VQKPERQEEEPGRTRGGPAGLQVAAGIPGSERQIVVLGVERFGEVLERLVLAFGGPGGGRADFAEAGGKDASKIAEMLAASRGIIEKLLSPKD